MKSFKLQDIKHPQDKAGLYTEKTPKLTQVAKALGEIGIATFLIGFIILANLLWFVPKQEARYIEPVMAQKAPVVAEMVKKDHSTGTIREVTMYTSRPEETDSSPCIGASGQDQCVLWRNGQNICATNAFPKGTELHINKLGDCLVLDRMNERFSERIDWYAGYDDDCLDGYDTYDVCPTLKRAKSFGLQSLLVSVK